MSEAPGSCSIPLKATRRPKGGKRRVIVTLGSAWDDFFDAPGVDLGERVQPGWGSSGK
eukprot:gene15773-15929_t